MDSTKLISSSRLAISILGGFSVYIDGKKIQDSAIGGRKARTLLKLLAHQRQFQLLRDKIAEILWPNLEIESANSQVYKALHFIRKSFAKHNKDAVNWIVINDDLIQLAPPGGPVTDAELFEKSARSGLKNKKLSELENAFSLYHGDFLPADRYVEWASFPREHYRQLFLDVLSTLAVMYEEQGDLSEAAEMMRLALDKEPTLEVAHRGLIRYFAKKGQTTRAFHQYDLCRELLREELGVAPSGETLKTLDDVREGKYAFPQSGKRQTSVSPVFEQKLEKLSPSSRHLLHIAAVIGKQVPYELLVLVWNSGNKKVTSGFFKTIGEIVNAGLLKGHGPDYLFRNALELGKVYASISKSRKQILHRQVVSQLLGLSVEADEPPVELIVWHYLRAGDKADAAKYLMQIGKRAEKIFAFELALQRYDQAIGVLEPLKDEEVMLLKCSILEFTGDVCRACGQIEKSYKAYEYTISRLKNQSEDKKHLIDLHLKMAVAAILHRKIDQSEKSLEKAVELAGDNHHSHARLLLTKAVVLWHQNRMEEAYDLAKQALEQAKAAGIDAEASQACEIVAMICLPLGRWDEGLQYEMELQKYGWPEEIVVAIDTHHCLGEYHVAKDQPRPGKHPDRQQKFQGDIPTAEDRFDAEGPNAWDTSCFSRSNRRLIVEKLASGLGHHTQVGAPACMAYSFARKSVLYTLMEKETLGWQAFQDGLIYARQVAKTNHCLQRLYGVGIWNRLEANDLEQAGSLIEKGEKLLSESTACPACILEIYPWSSFYYLQTGQWEKASACGKAVLELTERTGNTVGKVIDLIIQSNLSIIKMDKNKAEGFRQKARQILDESVPKTARLPLTYFLKRMERQQTDLVEC